MIRSISISPVLNGFIVSVGCQQLVYGDAAGLIDDIRSYLSNPDDTEKRILDSAVNRKHVYPENMGSELAACREAGEIPISAIR